MASFYIQSITSGNETEVTYDYNGYSSMIFTNTGTSAAVTIDLYIKNSAGSIVAYFLNNVKIPNGASLKLLNDEFSFDNITYTLYIDSDNGNGKIDIITRY